MEMIKRTPRNAESVDYQESDKKSMNMSKGDPLDLLKGLSDMFVSYNPNLDFENTLDF
jgi:hypothetical protein